MIRDLIISNRSCRRFHQEFAIDRRTLEELVELARYSASAANLQPLKYILSCEPAKNARIFSTLAWAGYLRDWPGPAEGERPSAYIVILGDTADQQHLRLRSRHRRPEHSARGPRTGTRRVHDRPDQARGTA